jgi:hypothetical protein
MSEGDAAFGGPFVRELAAKLRRLEDIEEIRQLKHAYCRLLDGGWEPQGPSHMGDLAALFTEDGVWDGRPSSPRAEGHAEIRAMIVSFRPVPFIMHIVTNPTITVDGDSAHGTWDVVLAMTSPTGQPNLAFGTYDEVYARTAEGWKFRSLRFYLSGLSRLDNGYTPPADTGMRAAAS